MVYLEAGITPDKSCSAGTSALKASKQFLSFDSQSDLTISG